MTGTGDLTNEIATALAVSPSTSISGLGMNQGAGKRGFWANPWVKSINQANQRGGGAERWS